MIRLLLQLHNGQGIRFKEPEVRSMGRTAAGVMGIRLYEGDYVVGMEVVSDEQRSSLCNRRWLW